MAQTSGPTIDSTTAPPPELRRSLKRLQNASRDFNRELARWEDKLEDLGISVEYVEPTTAQEGTGENT